MRHAVRKKIRKHDVSIKFTVKYTTKYTIKQIIIPSDCIMNGALNKVINNPVTVMALNSFNLINHMMYI